MNTTEFRRELPAHWFCDHGLSPARAEALLAHRARVAQKCTGKAKKPVFLFETQVVKGPWELPQDRERLGRELGRSALMRYWALPSNPCAVLEPALFEHPKTRGIYLVTPALYQPPGAERPWITESVSQSVSRVGPRQLEVISRASVGVVRVSDLVRQTPSWLESSVETWEHLIHRCLLGCGDSGLHNMLVNPVNKRAVGVDLDENRGSFQPAHKTWVELLFKRPPARKLMPHLESSLRRQHASIQAILERLDLLCDDAQSTKIARDHRLPMAEIRDRLCAVQEALLGQDIAV